MNIEVLRAKINDNVTKMRALVDEYETRDDDFSEEDQTRFDDWKTEVEADKELLAKLEERHAVLVDSVDTGTGKRVGGTDVGYQSNVKKSPYDLSELRFDTSAKDLRQRAMTAIEEDAHLPDNMKDEATRKLRFDKRGELAVLMLHTGSDAYRSAFPKVAVGAEWALTDDERQALLRAQSVGTDGAGGFAVPFTLDPTIVLTNDGAINPMRQIASIKTTTTNDWNGVSSAGATANWRAEAAEVGDDSITITQPSIPVHRMDVFVPYSIEIEMDWAQMETELRAAMDDAKQRKEAEAHMVGTGTDQPTGLATALDGGTSELSPGTAETFVQNDVFELRRQLPPRYRMNRDMPAWFANIGTYDTIRQFDTGGGGGFWTDMSDGTPDRLVSYRTYEFSEMDDAQDIDAAATADNQILICGDPKQYYIVDRMGARIETVPHLFNTASNRPDGTRGLLMFLRTGADVIDIAGFRMLNVATAA